ncbi:unnamed protein product [Adineta steineri]|uniref:RRM domain-containing protein n=1 Tax=Adineta steineri TaxID=433720 RepID=A0A814T4Q6_9BILA|nr:unnamed protein product [Adineta steineri]
MSTVSTYRRHIDSIHLEICIGGLSYQTEPHTLLTYFEQFGTISQYNFTSPTGGGYVFICYENSQSVDRCIANRPHRLDGRHLYVKRALPFDPEYPNEHMNSIRDIMIICNSLDIDEEYLKNLREYFSSYGVVYACKLCHETNYDYILVEFADYDQVDRIILDKPHHFNNQELNLMKCIATNKKLMNIKYSSKENSVIAKDAIDINDDQKFLKYELNYKNDLAEKSNHHISEIDLANEVYRLQNLIKKLNEDFSIKRRQLEENCCEQLRKLNEDADKTHRLQQHLEQEYTKLLVEHESLKHENEVLNEQYLMTELENFEMTSYYEQILAEEKAKTAQYETEYTQILQWLYDNDSPLPSSPHHHLISISQTSLSPPLPAIPDDDDDDD